ncbi:MAG TPA: hypothetical protein VFJ29_01435 [Candidatus Kapabacteria bacterium]|nr:hypothetical protein [Candidatus Kapabacteria bacterium]
MLSLFFSVSMDCANGLPIAVMFSFYGWSLWRKDTGFVVWVEKLSVIPAKAGIRQSIT